MNLIDTYKEVAAFNQQLLNKAVAMLHGSAAVTTDQINQQLLEMYAASTVQRALPVCFNFNNHLCYNPVEQPGVTCKPEDLLKIVVSSEKDGCYVVNSRMMTFRKDLAHVFQNLQQAVQQVKVGVKSGDSVQKFGGLVEQTLTVLNLGAVVNVSGSGTSVGNYQTNPRLVLGKNSSADVLVPGFYHLELHVVEGAVGVEAKKYGQEKVLKFELKDEERPEWEELFARYPNTKDFKYLRNWFSLRDMQQVLGLSLTGKVLAEISMEQKLTGYCSLNIPSGALCFSYVETVQLTEQGVVSLV